MDNGRPLGGNSGFTLVVAIVTDSLAGTIVFEMMISVWPSVATGSAWARFGGITTEWRDGALAATGAAGAGLTGTEVAALLGATPFEKKLARAATMPLTGLFATAGTVGRLSVESALSKLSKLESAFSTSGERVTP